MNRQDIDELTEVFVEESQEIVESLTKDVLALEQYVETPDKIDRELINNIFRYVHTLKGNSGLAGADKLRDLAHKLESLLDRLRKDKIRLQSEMVDLLFEAIDRFKAILQEIMSKQDQGVTITDLTQRLEILLEGGGVSEDVPAPPAPPKAESPEHKPVPPLPAVPKSIAAQGGPAFIPDDIKRILTEYEETRLIENVRNQLIIYELTLNLMMDGFDRVVSRAIDHLNTLGEVIAKIPSSKTLPHYELQVRIIFAAAASVQALTDVVKTATELAPRDFSIKPLIEPDRPVIALDEFIRPPKPAPTPKPPVKAAPIPKIVAERPETSREVTRKEQAKEPPRAIPTPTPVTVSPKRKTEPEDKAEKPEHDQVETTGNMVKVDIKKLDNLMNIVGELVLAKARYVQLESELEALAEHKPLQENLKRNNKLTSKKLEDLREGILQVRMVQVGTLFSKFPKLVRDLAKDNKKQLRLVREGEKTELDKAVIDEMGRPLMHLIRNSAGHGIEAPQQRLEKGKPEVGTITLRAYQEGSYIVIEVEDDGGGINIERVREKAIENGLLEKNSKLSDTEIINFIFHPGFSTAKEVTETSGRGVGMDDVKMTITKLKGFIDTRTTRHVGTKFILKLPLTLAIIQVLLIKANTHTYAIPLSSVTESFRLDPNKIEIVDGQEVTQLRDRVLPLLRINEALNLPENGTGRGEGQTASRKYIVVIELADKRIGLVVDDLLGQQEIVIKPLGRYLLHTPGFAGATTLGNGRVVLILDLVSLIENLNRKRLQRKKLEKARIPQKSGKRAALNEHRATP